MEPEQTTESTTTEFNSNIATLQRIDLLLRLCANAAFNQDLDSWFKHLTNLRKEAIVKMKHNSKDGNCKNKCQKCEQERFFEKLSKDMNIFSRHPGDQNLIRTLARELDAYEMIIRDFMDKKGMLLKEGKDMSGL